MAVAFDRDALLDAFGPWAAAPSDAMREHLTFGSSREFVSRNIFKG